jgi:ATP/maltotriose-dependent transcriptional regulator MalT
MARTATAGILQRRRVIQRPRLLALLDESTARVKTLVAPAGYGKTTLAEQWVEGGGRRGAWFTARQSSTDVAALALGLARASTDLVSDCDVRLREHLRALSGSTAKVDVLAEILAEDLADWASAGWLVLDDYHEIAGAEEAEHLVAALVAAAPVQLLIASRQRPTWVSARRILYDEVLELNQTTLAMDASEASEVLAGRSPPSASGLVAVANGWPAVIGLAGVTTAEIEDPEQLPEALYRFFAEEVFESFEDEVKAGLATLAVAPILDRDLATELLGDRVDNVCSAGIDVGILVERGSQLELHPLARSFLEDRCAQLGFVPEQSSVTTCLEYYRGRHDWDAAFDVIARNRLGNDLEPLLLDALDELLATARLQTIEAWCEMGASLDVEAPTFALARAEVALRHGNLAEAQTFAEAAAIDDSVLKFRALSVAGRAAHIASREDAALGLYRQAEAAARTESARRDALWGQVLCAIELELPEAKSMLGLLREDVLLSDPRDVVRASGCTLTYQVRAGSLDLAEADRTFGLLPALSDPLVESAFRSMYSYTLALSSRYDEAVEVAEGLLTTARRYRLDFALAYAFCAGAVAHAGLRNWAQAEKQADHAIRAARGRRDSHAEQFAYGVCVRVLAQQGKCHEALALKVPELSSALPASRAEVLGSLALVLAAAGRSGEALAWVDEIRETTRAIESAVLIPAVEAIASLRQKRPGAVDLVMGLEDAAFVTGAVDFLVTTYRAAPELLAVLLRASQRRERLHALIRRARDEDLADAVGHRVTVAHDRRARLSPREQEVFDLLRQGLTNRQIGQLLYISESTVKVHAHHVYDKVGVRSRTALVVQAALERSGQATSEMGADEADADS